MKRKFKRFKSTKPKRSKKPIKFAELVSKKDFELIKKYLAQHPLVHREHA